MKLYKTLMISATLVCHHAAWSVGVPEDFKDDAPMVSAPASASKEEIEEISITMPRFGVDKYGSFEVKADGTKLYKAVNAHGREVSFTVCPGEESISGIVDQKKEGTLQPDRDYSKKSNWVQTRDSVKGQVNKLAGTDLL